MVRPSHALGALLAASQVAYGLESPRPAWMTRSIVGLLLTTSTVDAVEQRGARGAAVVAAAGSIGFGAELLGVHTGKPFGPYEYPGKLGPKVLGVPVLAAAAWALLTRPSRVAADWATRPTEAAEATGCLTTQDGPATTFGRSSVPRTTFARRAARVAAGATALTAWDVFLDPRMVREGYWSWPGGGRYEGIPASNFAGWWVTGLVIFAVAELIDPADDPGLPAPSPAVPGERSGDTALVLFAWTWVGELIANVLLWRRPRIALAGGLSMATVAVPAVLRRVRAALGR